MNDSATIVIGGRTRFLTAADGDALKAALIRYLSKEPAAATLEDHAELLVVTQNATSFVDPDGLLHVGAWLVDPGAGSPTLTYRTWSAETSRRYYVAQLAYVRDTWWVTSVDDKRVVAMN